MTLKEATVLILDILKQVMEEKLSSNNVEVVTVTPGDMYHVLTKEELEEVVTYFIKCKFIIVVNFYHCI